MKTEHLKSMVPQNKQRSVVALLLFVFLTFYPCAPGAAQLRDQKHVTAIQLGGAAEGSRVTVVSNSPLLDYEAFRRGDRFYVKIPGADFSSATPRFRANGFEDVQVQKVGDSLIVSFKLQPGATARVDQRGNRLDIVFSAPNRGSSISGAGAGSSAQGNRDRGSEAAGPTPPESPGSRPRVVTGQNRAVNESRAPGDPRWQTYPKTSSGKRSNQAGNNKPTPATLSTAPASPSSSPSSILSQAPSTPYQPLTTTTPNASSSPAAIGASSNSQNSTSWKDRVAAARRWMSSNRLATLLGALILISLIVYLVMALRRRQTRVVKGKGAKAPKVQPRYSPDAGLPEPSNTSRHEPAPRPDTPQPTPMRSAAAASAQDQPRTKPNVVSPTVSHDEHASEKEEREVFEL